MIPKTVKPNSKVKDHIKILQTDYTKYFKNCLKIRDKQSNIVPFIVNQEQQELVDIIQDWKQTYPDQTNRPTLYIVIPKPRQVGYSTVTEAVFFHDLNFAFNKVAMIISYDVDSATVINDMSNRFYQYLPQVIKPKRRKSQGKGILFEDPQFRPELPTSETNKPGLQSKFLIETANNVNAGSSYTINYLHISELAKWSNPEETLTSLLQSVPKNDSIVVVESTAKGLNYFYDLCNDAKHGRNNYKLLFIPWFRHAEYATKYTGFELTDEERKLQETFHISLDQLQWRRDTIKDKCQNNLDIFHQEYPSYLEEAFVTTGKPVFNVADVMSRMNHAPKPIKTGRFEYQLDISEKIIPNTIKWVDDENGAIRIYEEPKRGYPYVIGGDTSGEGSDYFIGYAIDNTTGKHVAMLRHQFDEDLYAAQMYCLGEYYNNALIGIEVNYSTHPTKELQRLGYSHLFMREVEDNISGGIAKKYGFRTDKLTRPIIIADLVALAREHIEIFNDLDTLEEMTTFIKNDKGRPEAMQGCHDDCVMAAAITYYIRSQQRYTPEENPTNERPRLKDTLIKPKKEARY